MVVSGWDIASLVTSCLVFSALVILVIVTIADRLEQRRKPPMPIIQPMTEDYLSDILQILESIEGKL